MSKSTILLPATRIQIAEVLCPVSQIGSVSEEPQILRVEEEDEIS
jgi:hypothetical protein